MIGLTAGTKAPVIRSNGTVHGFRGVGGRAGGWVRHCGTGAPSYWVWGPSGGGFDYPFADWRGPTGGKLEAPTISGRGSRYSFRRKLTEASRLQS